MYCAPSLVRRKPGVLRPGFVGMRGQWSYDDYDVQDFEYTPPCTNRRGGEGILDSNPKLKLTTTWRNYRQSLLRGSHYARDLFFASWPPNGCLLDVSYYDHVAKHKLKWDNERALLAIRVASSYYASNFCKAPFPLIRFAGVESLDI